jgi:hypothetical protein
MRVRVYVFHSCQVEERQVGLWQRSYNFRPSATLQDLLHWQPVTVPLRFCTFTGETGNDFFGDRWCSYNDVQSSPLINVRYNAKCSLTYVEFYGTGWTVRGSIPGADEIFHTRPHRPKGPPSLLGFFLGGTAEVQRPKRDVDQPSPPSKKGKTVP